MNGFDSIKWVNNYFRWYNYFLRDDKLDGMTTACAWKDAGASAETEKPMQFWIKKL